MGKNEMTKSDASRIQSGQAKSGGDMSSKGFAARAQSAGDRQQYAASGGQQNTGHGHGGSRGTTGGSGKSK
ncbi:hypothetical protein F4811DRAFT_549878 [Daldinia bambusicola]|nr:hypothetical protein F4811DRAFT_549878 [Daldinia bambusicola]